MPVSKYRFFRFFYNQLLKLLNIFFSTLGLRDISLKRINGIWQQAIQIWNLFLNVFYERWYRVIIDSNKEFLFFGRDMFIIKETSKTRRKRGSKNVSRIGLTCHVLLRETRTRQELSIFSWRYKGTRQLPGHSMHVPRFLYSLPLLCLDPFTHTKRQIVESVECV